MGECAAENLALRLLNIDPGFRTMYEKETEGTLAFNICSEDTYISNTSIPIYLVQNCIKTCFTTLLAEQVIWSHPCRCKGQAFT